MGDTMPREMPELPRQKMARATLRGESRCQKLAPRELGALIERGFRLAGMNNQQAANALGYSDQSVVGKWIAGTEQPQLDRILVTKRVNVGFLLAWAEFLQQDVETETTFRVRSRRLL